MSAIQQITIEPIDGKFWFCQHGVYEKGSVLEDQEFRQLVQAYDTLEEAVAAHPDAEVLDYDAAPPLATMPLVAPDWFDPMDAGEAWGEDDY